MVNGLPYHVRAGYRVLDTLINVRGETVGPRKKLLPDVDVRVPPPLRIGIGLDVPNPAMAARQFASPAVPFPAAPPGGATSGWLFHVDAKGVLLTSLEPLRDGNRIVGVRGRLLETTGQAGAVRVSGFRPFVMGQRCLFSSEPQEELALENGKLRIDLAAYDFAEFTARW
ncbi:MAG: hypothetical protein QM811_02855 [Pirellulales bacterium]